MSFDTTYVSESSDYNKIFASCFNPAVKGKYAVGIVDMEGFTLSLRKAG